MALADLAAGSGRDTLELTDTMFDGLAAEGFRFTAVATITSATSSVEALFTWSSALRDRVRYLVGKNRIAADEFAYFEDTEPGRAFVAAAKPAIFGLRARAKPALRSPLRACRLRGSRKAGGRWWAARRGPSSALLRARGSAAAPSHRPGQPRFGRYGAQSEPG